jgi:hypothetical protein
MATLKFVLLSVLATVILAGHLCHARSLTTYTCPTGWAPCAPLNLCRNLQADPWHCGACGTRCGLFALCKAGQCTCGLGSTSCPGAGCRQLKVDPTHCGACDNACAPGQVCVNGTCGCVPYALPLTFLPGQTGCPGEVDRTWECVDTTTDVSNCGGCKQACPETDTCEAGVCTTTVPVDPMLHRM